jgi:cytoskeletal protein RodZ
LIFALTSIANENLTLYLLCFTFNLSSSTLYSIAAHSLGAIICFDILANQIVTPPTTTTTNSSTTNSDSSTSDTASTAPESMHPIDITTATTGTTSCSGSAAAAVDGAAAAAADSNVIPNSATATPSPLAYYAGSTQFPQVHGHIDNLFCLGSPIGMFLMIRGQHRALGKGIQTCTLY